MASFLIPTIIILFLIGYIVYRFKTMKKVCFCLDKGGSLEDGLFKPDFERDDLKLLFSSCESNNIPSEIAKGFFISVYNELLWLHEPAAFGLDDNRYQLWDLDEEIEDVINFIFRNHNIEEVKWADDEILDLVTFKDILLYLNDKLANQPLNLTAKHQRYRMFRGTHQVIK